MCFLGVEELQLAPNVEAHPFTISSPPAMAGDDLTKNVLTFHIKDMGHHTFTHALCALARSRTLSPNALQRTSNATAACHSY